MNRLFQFWAADFSISKDDMTIFGICIGVYHILQASARRSIRSFVNQSLRWSVTLSSKTRKFVILTK